MYTPYKAHADEFYRSELRRMVRRLQLVKVRELLGAKQVK